MWEHFFSRPSCFPIKIFRKGNHVPILSCEKRYEVRRENQERRGGRRTYIVVVIRTELLPFLVSPSAKAAIASLSPSFSALLWCSDGPRQMTTRDKEGHKKDYGSKFCLEGYFHPTRVMSAFPFLPPTKYDQDFPLKVGAGYTGWSERSSSRTFVGIAREPLECCILSFVRREEVSGLNWT